MTEWAVAVLLVCGGTFVLLATIGILRFPDVFTRMHAATKAGTLGKVCLFTAVMVHFQDWGVSTRALLVIGFFFITAPVAAHMIGRAAYVTGVRFWPGTIVDEWSSRDRS